MNTLTLRKQIKWRAKILFLFILFFFVAMGFPAFETPKIFCIKGAEAKVSKPASRNYEARVHHRTKRRNQRRVAAGTRVHTLPGKCTRVRRGGVVYHHCSGVYYRPYYEGTKVVYVVETP